MARIRSVHPSLFTDEAWVSCSPLARLLYIGLWTDADDQGLFEWKPLQIKMRLLPGDAGDVAALLGELAGVDLIAAFEHAGKRFGAIKQFRKYQRPKKPNAVHTLPAELRDYVAIDDDDDPTANLRRELCEEQSGRCFYCEVEITPYSKRLNSLEIDHRVPRVRGGTDERENLVAACRACNRGKCDRSESEWRAILAGRIANGSVAFANRELASQMEDGGCRMEEGTVDATAPTVGERAGEDLFEDLWRDYPHHKGRSSPPKSREAFAAIAAEFQSQLPAAAVRFRREAKHPPNGPPALEKWLADERWRDWLPDEAAPAVAVAAWQGPADIRAEFVKEMGEAWARSYIDPATWQDVPERALIPRNSYAGQKIVGEARKVLSALKLSVLEKAA